MPDNPIFHSGSYGDWFQEWIKTRASTGRILPTDLFFDGLFVSPFFCQELKYCVGLYLAALGFVYFLRGRGVSDFAAYSAALLLVFSGYWITLYSAGHAGWFIWMSYGLWAFGLIDRALTTGKYRYWALLGLDLAWAGYHQQDIWLLFTVFAFAYFVFRLVQTKQLPWKGALLAAGVFAVAFIPGLIESLRVVGERENAIASTNSPQSSTSNLQPSTSSEQRWEFVTNWSLPADETAEFLIPRLNGDTSCPLTLTLARKAGKDTQPYTGALGRPLNAKSGNYRQHSLYIGFATLLFALLSLFAIRKFDTTQFAIRKFENSKIIIFFALSTLLFYLLSLGRYFEPLYRCIFALPVGDLIRCPVKWHHLTEFCLAVLAAYGIDATAKLFKPFKLLKPIQLALVLISFGILAWNASLYCAPVNIAKSRRLKCSGSLQVLTRQQFADPQVALLVRSGRIVSLANYLGHPDYFLVTLLDK